MKTLDDLFAIILYETKMNVGKAVQYTFSIDTRYCWCSMRQTTQLVEGEKVIQDRDIFNHLYFKTPEELQLVYWTIYHNGRSRDKG